MKTQIKILLSVFTLALVLAGANKAVAIELTYEEGEAIGLRNGKLAAKRVAKQTVEEAEDQLNCQRLGEYEEALNEIFYSVDENFKRESEFQEGFYQGYLSGLSEEEEIVLEACRCAQKNNRGPASAGLRHRVHRGGRVVRVSRPRVERRRPVSPRARVVVRPAQRQGSLEDRAVRFFLAYAERKTCAELGDLLREVSNTVLDIVQNPETDRSRADHCGRNPNCQSISLRDLVKNPRFMSIVIGRLNEAYTQCNRTCVEDGQAIGQMMAVSYCHASMELDGLPDGEIVLQSPLPVCETGNHLGCINSYEKTARSISGCEDYTRDEFEHEFFSSVSEDCQIDES